MVLFKAIHKRQERRVQFQKSVKREKQENQAGFNTSQFANQETTCVFAICVNKYDFLC